MPGASSTALTTTTLIGEALDRALVGTLDNPRASREGTC
jgi:hypothetical protein